LLISILVHGVQNFFELTHVRCRAVHTREGGLQRY
jgi:hypothetical protein